MSRKTIIMVAGIWLFNVIPCFLLMVGSMTYVAPEAIALVTDYLCITGEEDVNLPNELKELNE
jgi:hypothetical protein